MVWCFFCTSRTTPHPQNTCIVMRANTYIADAANETGGVQSWPLGMFVWHRRPLSISVRDWGWWCMPLHGKKCWVTGIRSWELLRSESASADCCWGEFLGQRFAAALLPRLLGKNPRAESHHKGATGRVRTGVQLLPVLCNCQLDYVACDFFIGPSSFKLL